MSDKLRRLILTEFALLLASLLALGCSPANQLAPEISPTQGAAASVKDRLESIPLGAPKMTPESDPSPPVLHSDKYLPPVPLGSGVNTAGGEDSPFILPDGNTLFFFFTPDVKIPAEKQVIDGVTGIYVSQKIDNEWQPAQRVILQNAGQLSLDGAECVQGDWMWFASARAGNYREIDIWTARLKEGKWQDWQNAGLVLNVQFRVGELHVSADGSEIYFHSTQPDGKGGLDIWYTHKENGQWQQPENVEAVNSPADEGWPFISQDGNELWFLRWYQGTPAIYFSSKVNGRWSEPELIISQFAGEPTLDARGNLYFVHHFFKDGQMIEADIYVAFRK